MARFIYIGTSATDDPTRASLPFIHAKGAVEAGHQAAIMLVGEAASLARPGIRQQIHGVGFLPLAETYAYIQQHQVPVYV